MVDGPIGLRTRSVSWSRMAETREIAVPNMPLQFSRLQWHFTPDGFELYGIDAWDCENRVQLRAVGADGKQTSDRSETDCAGMAAQATERRTNPRRAGRAGSGQRYEIGNPAHRRRRPGGAGGPLILSLTRRVWGVLSESLTCQST